MKRLPWRQPVESSIGIWTLLIILQSWVLNQLVDAWDVGGMLSQQRALPFAVSVPRNTPDVLDDTRGSTRLGRLYQVPVVQSFPETVTNYRYVSDNNSNTRRRMLTLAIGASVSVGFVHSSNAQPDLLSGLQPATEEKPQIPFPDAASLKLQQQQASLEGLIYLRNPRSERRPMGNDVIFLTVRTAEQPQVVIAGARIPVSRIGSFPVRFQMSAQNVVLESPIATSRQEVWLNAMRSDLVVQAMVCPVTDERWNSTSSRLQPEFNALSNVCTETNGVPPIQATGLAKLVRLQQSNGETTLIRAPVSLPLE